MTTAYRVQEWRRPLRGFRRNWHTCNLGEEDLSCDVINIHFIVYDIYVTIPKNLFNKLTTDYYWTIVGCFLRKNMWKIDRKDPITKKKTFPRFRKRRWGTNNGKIQRHSSSNRHTNKQINKNYIRGAALERQQIQLLMGWTLSAPNFRPHWSSAFFMFLTNYRLERNFICKFEWLNVKQLRSRWDGSYEPSHLNLRCLQKPHMTVKEFTSLHDCNIALNSSASQNYKYVFGRA